MKITLLTIGTRGDVQPFVALGVGLEEAGHVVTLATGKGFEAFVEERGLRHAALDADLLERLQSPEGKAAVSGTNLFGTIKKAASMYRRVLDQEWAATRGAGAVVYHPKALGGYHIAEALGVPAFLAHPVPMFSPTRAFPNPVLPVANLGNFLNKSSYEAFLWLMSAPFRRVINRWRRETLGLPPRPFLASELELHGRPVRRLVCCSPRVVVPPADWDEYTAVTGYWFLDRPRAWRPPARLAEFLESGPPPVYAGFGSLAAWSPDNAVNAAIDALGEVRPTRRDSDGRRPVFAPRARLCVSDRAGAPRLDIPQDGGGGAPRWGGHDRRGPACRQADGCLPDFHQRSSVLGQAGLRSGGGTGAHPSAKAHGGSPAPYVSPPRTAECAGAPKGLGRRSGPSTA